MDPEMFAAMDKFNEELINAGILLDGTGLTPGSAVPVFGSSARIVPSPTGHSTQRNTRYADQKNSVIIPMVNDFLDAKPPKK